MIRRRVFAIIIMLSGTAALAHQGVKNAAVKARMHGMSVIAKDMKTLGVMAKGASDFNSDVARTAAASIATHASQVPDLFAANETDPKSEARPLIWEAFDDFSNKAEELETIALELSESISTPEDLKNAVRALGATCKTCHEMYRE